MTHRKEVLVLLVLFTLLCVTQVDSGGDKLLSRRKRYVVFPEGSSFSIALCMTLRALTGDNIFYEGMNWGVAYDLPNETKRNLEPFLEFRSDKIKKHDDHYQGGNNNYKYNGWNNDRKYYVPSMKKYSKSERYIVQRRHRRDLYNKLEVIMKAMGFDGRTCILRALCEASQRLMPKGNSLIEEMIKIAFSFPLTKVFSFEPPEHHTYDAAHKAGHEGRDCIAMFPSCTISLIDLALGRYDSPSPDYGEVQEESTSSSTKPTSRRYSMK